MPMDKKNILKMIQATDHIPPSGKTSAEKETALKKEETKKPGFELPEGYLMAQEMKELFEEDTVTHIQGTSEPESD